MGWERVRAAWTGHGKEGALRCCVRARQLLVVDWWLV